MVDENVQLLIEGEAIGDAANTARTTATKVLPVQMIDAAGKVLSAAAVGAVNDGAVTDPSASGSLVALLKGLLTAINTLNTVIGSVSDAAVTNPASDGTLIALTKGVLTNTTPAG